MKYFQILIIALLGFNLSGQHQDCADAYWLSEIDETYEFEMLEGVGDDDDEDKSECITVANSPTFSSHWIRFCISEPGSFYFTITPELEEYDIDFIVYQLDESGDCDSMEAIRCMHSGESLGQVSSPCLGATGLSPDETDLNESAGCQTGDNNFVAALECSEGEEYAIFIESFFIPAENLMTVDFFGTATLKNGTSTSTPKEEAISLSPNPVHSDLTMNGMKSGTRYQIIDARGIERQSGVIENQSIDTSLLTSGLYYIRAQGKVWSFVKL